MVVHLKNSLAFGEDWVDPDKHCPWCGFTGAACHEIKYGTYLEKCVRRQIDMYKKHKVEVDEETCDKMYMDMYFFLEEFDHYKRMPGMKMCDDVTVELPHCMECGSYWNVLQLLDAGNDIEEK